MVVDKTIKFEIDDKTNQYILPMTNFNPLKKDKQGNLIPYHQHAQYLRQEKQIFLQKQFIGKMMGTTQNEENKFYTAE